MKRTRYFWEDNDTVYLKKKVDQILHQFDDECLELEDQLNLVEVVLKRLKVKYTDLKKDHQEKAKLINERIKEIGL